MAIKFSQLTTSAVLDPSVDYVPVIRKVGALFSNYRVLPGTINSVSITHAALAALIVAGTVQQVRYLVSNASGADEGVIVTGATTTTVSNEAIGNFLNADHNAVGDYSAVVGFGTQIGIWNSSLTPTIHDVCIWNNSHYENLTGVVGTAPSGDAVNWLLLARTRTTGYIPEADNIIYDFTNDIIQYREDILENRLSGNITTWCWGNPAATFCFGTLSGSMDFRNQAGLVTNCNLNGVSGGTVAIPNSFTGVLKNLVFDGASLINGAATLDLTNCAGSVDSWNISNGCTLTAPLNNAIKVGNIRVSLPIAYAFVAGTNLSDKTCEDGFADFASVNITVTNIVVLTGNEICGKINITSSGATQTIDTITGLSQQYFPVRFYPISGKTITFTTIAANYKLSGGINAVLIGDNGDWIEFTNIGGTIYQTNGDTY